MIMPDRVRVYVTELCVTLGLTTGLASYLPTINMLLDSLLKIISIVAAVTVVIINMPKVQKVISKYLKKR